MRILFDTCIIIDALQRREPFFENAQKLFLMTANQQFIGYISAKSTTDIYYLMHRHFHDDSKCRSILSTLFALFDVLDTTASDCYSALISKVTDYEGAVMIQTAINSKVDCIVTRNTSDYFKSSIPVFTPSEFFIKLEEGK